MEHPNSRTCQGPYEACICDCVSVYTVYTWREVVTTTLKTLSVVLPAPPASLPSSAVECYILPSRHAHLFINIHVLTHPINLFLTECQSALVT